MVYTQEDSSLATCSVLWGFYFAIGIQLWHLLTVKDLPGCAVEGKQKSDS